MRDLDLLASRSSEGDIRAFVFESLRHLVVEGPWPFGLVLGGRSNRTEPTRCLVCQVCVGIFVFARSAHTSQAGASPRALIFLSGKPLRPLNWTASFATCWRRQCQRLGRDLVCLIVRRLSLFDGLGNCKVLGLDACLRPTSSEHVVTLCL